MHANAFAKNILEAFNSTLHFADPDSFDENSKLFSLYSTPTTK